LPATGLVMTCLPSAGCRTSPDHPSWSFHTRRRHQTSVYGGHPSVRWRGLTGCLSTGGSRCHWTTVKEILAIICKHGGLES
jgi:hypothetical protein